MACSRAWCFRLRPSPEADRGTLIRRVTLDLTGLLPTPKEVDDFQKDESPDAFAKMNADVEKNPSISAPERRVFLRHVHARAQHGGADKQGRLVLPEDVCKQLGLKGEVALVGGRGRFEIWNLQKWKRAHEEETATYQHVAHAIGL